MAYLVRVCVPIKYVIRRVPSMFCSNLSISLTLAHSVSLSVSLSLAFVSFNIDTSESDLLSLHIIEFCVALQLYSFCKKKTKNQKMNWQYTDRAHNERIYDGI